MKRGFSGTRPAAPLPSRRPRSKVGSRSSWLVGSILVCVVLSISATIYINYSGMKTAMSAAELPNLNYMKGLSLVPSILGGAAKQKSHMPWDNPISVEEYEKFITRKTRIVSGFLSEPDGTLVPDTRTVGGDWHQKDIDSSDEPVIKHRRISENINFNYTISSQFRDLLCSDTSIWKGIYYVKTFEPECVAKGEEDEPSMRSKSELVTFVDEKRQNLKYDDRPAFYLDLTEGGKHNPMHLLHNNIFPSTFYHLTCLSDDGNVALLPSNLDSFEWLDRYLRRLMGSLAGIGNVVEFESDRETWCFPKVTYIRGDYEQHPGPFLGMMCPFGSKLSPVQQEECDKIAKVTIQFMSQVLRSFIESRSTKEESPSDRAIRIFVYDRQEQSQRRWMNSKDAIDQLKGLQGVEVVEVKSFNVPLEEQCGNFYDADIMVMPHGAALANALCSRPESAIVEILKKCYTYDELWFHSITDALALSHSVVECKEKNGEEETISADDVVEHVRLLLPSVRRRLQSAAGR
uniref:Glycosyltransferase 61 catalytic domain-containing protein n=2 Tax=Rhodosorus marinus TaxID=101924 RepID=A0A7S2ZW86_9RHOD|mmetsp:Transcript_33991/g.133283  ORF Transcript_33991/g.133283 Transcript_33991/m.133283 type:complete len:517 (+) Transcript_33991:223-1773(+)